MNLFAFLLIGRKRNHGLELSPDNKSHRVQTHARRVDGGEDVVPFLLQYLNLIRRNRGIHFLQRPQPADFPGEDISGLVASFSDKDTRLLLNLRSAVAHHLGHNSLADRRVFQHRGIDGIFQFLRQQLG